MRETPKLLTATLLILSLLGIGAAAAPLADAAHGARHRRVHVRHDAKQRCAGHRSRRCETNATEPAPHAKPHREAAPRVKPTRGRRRRAEVESSEASTEANAAAEVAARIAAVLSTPCQNTEITPDSENIAAARAAVLCLINRERAEHGVAPLVANADLEAAAENHCEELIADDYFAHIAPDGETPVQRIEATGYVPGPSVGYVIGENLAWGTYVLSTPKAIVEAWIASPGHLANILESRYVETGIGITPAVPESLGNGNPGATYAEEFGVIVH